MENPKEFFIIDEDQLRKLDKVRKVLYKENRLSGDEMRDLAHILTSVLEGVFRETY